MRQKHTLSQQQLEQLQAQITQKQQQLQKRLPEYSIGGYVAANKRLGTHIANAPEGVKQKAQALNLSVKALLEVNIGRFPEGSSKDIKTQISKANETLLSTQIDCRQWMRKGALLMEHTNFIQDAANHDAVRTSLTNQIICLKKTLDTLNTISKTGDPLLGYTITQVLLDEANKAASVFQLPELNPNSPTSGDTAPVNLLIKQLNECLQHWEDIKYFLNDKSIKTDKIDEATRRREAALRAQIKHILGAVNTYLNAAFLKQEYLVDNSTFHPNFINALLALDDEFDPDQKSGITNNSWVRATQHSKGHASLSYKVKKNTGNKRSLRDKNENIRIEAWWQAVKELEKSDIPLAKGASSEDIADALMTNGKNWPKHYPWMSLGHIRQMLGIEERPAVKYTQYTRSNGSISTHFSFRDSDTRNKCLERARDISKQMDKNEQEGKNKKNELSGQASSNNDKTGASISMQGWRAGAGDGARVELEANGTQENDSSSEDSACPLGPKAL